MPGKRTNDAAGQIREAARHAMAMAHLLAKARHGKVRDEDREPLLWECVAANKTAERLRKRARHQEGAAR